MSLLSLFPNEVKTPYQATMMTVYQDIMDQLQATSTAWTEGEPL
jgi:hypothetical protein